MFEWSIQIDLFLLSTEKPGLDRLYIEAVSHRLDSTIRNILIFSKDMGTHVSELRILKFSNPNPRRCRDGDNHKAQKCPRPDVDSVVLRLQPWGLRISNKGRGHVDAGLARLEISIPHPISHPSRTGSDHPAGRHEPCFSQC